MARDQLPLRTERHDCLAMKRQQEYLYIYIILILLLLRLIIYDRWLVSGY